MRKQEPSVTRVLLFLFGALLIHFSLSGRIFFSDLWPKLCCTTLAPVALARYSAFVSFLSLFWSFKKRAVLKS